MKNGYYVHRAGDNLRETADYSGPFNDYKAAKRRRDEPIIERENPEFDTMSYIKNNKQTLVESEAQVKRMRMFAGWK